MGGAGPSGGNAPEPTTISDVMQEFTTGEPGLVYPDDSQPTAVHLQDGTEVEVEVPAPFRPSYRRVCPESLYDFRMW